MQRTNSIIGDPEPVTSVEPPKQPKLQPTDWEKLANGSDYKVVREYLEGRITFYQRYLPSGTPVENLSKEQQMDAWGNATVIITEFEGLLKTLEAHKHRQ